MAGILARKIEMTRVIKDDKFVPVTLLEIPKMQVIGYKTMEKDGYSAIIVGVVGKEEVKLGAWKKALSPRTFSVVNEFRIEASEEGQKEIGSTLGFADLEGVETVSLTGTSKGRGFAGAMKRHNFSGGPGGHGSKFHRALGSIEIVNEAAGIIGVRGPVPGARASLVHIYL